MVSGVVRFGRYELLERIALGGMAEVHLARATGPMAFAKDVVIKRILPQFGQDAEFLRMFVTEAKLVSQFVHPNIVQVYEFGEVDGRNYMAMERVDGLDLRRLWMFLAKRKQRLPTVLSLFIVSQFLDGLDYAHRATGPDGIAFGVVHRDVSPSNVLISERGEVKITDFGIALVTSEARGTDRLFKGKHEYMAPEVLADESVDRRADVFSAGVVRSQLLLGRRLFSGETDLERLERVSRADISVFERHASKFPPGVVEAVRQALHRDPARRFHSARDLKRALDQQLRESDPVIDSEMLALFVHQHVLSGLGRRAGPAKIP